MKLNSQVQWSNAIGREPDSCMQHGMQRQCINANSNNVQKQVQQHEQVWRHANASKQVNNNVELNATYSPMNHQRGN